MSNSLADLLGQRYFEEPPEITAIKAYVHNTFGAEAEVLIRERDIVVTVASAALAGSLRLKLPELKRAANTGKRLVLRIR